MLPTTFQNLEELHALLAQHLELHEGVFSLFGLKPGMTFERVREVLGEPRHESLDVTAQQSLQFVVPIDHATHGLREHHKLTLGFFSFHHQPIGIIRLSYDYYRTGEEAEPFHQALRAFTSALVTKFGKPAKRSNRRGKAELTYESGKCRLGVYESFPVVVLQVMALDRPHS